MKVLATVLLAAAAAASAMPQAPGAPGNPLVPGLLQNLAERQVLLSGANTEAGNPCLREANTEAERQLCIVQAEFAARAAQTVGFTPEGILVGHSGAVGRDVYPGYQNLQL